MNITVVTRADLIARFEALGLVAGRFLPASGLPAYLIAQMRMGKYGSQQSQPYMERLDQALTAEETKRATPVPVGLTEPLGVDMMKLRDRAPPGGRTDTGEPLSELRKQLGDACEAARTAKELSELASRVGAMAARGDLPIALMRAIHENISRREQLLADERLELEQSRAGEETVVRIVYVNGWTGGPLPESVG